MTTPRIRIRRAGFDARPERPSSLRAQAQRVFRAAAEREERLERPTPNPSPQGGGEHSVRGEMQTTSITQLVRALYEDSVVPVAEIARLAGVSWRTLYKYARKGGWRRRRATQDIASAVAKRAAKRTAAPPPPFRTLKGAGGRFIRNADAGKPARRGLKALDPEGEACSVALCRRAATLSDRAVSRTQALREAMSDARTIALLVQVVRDVAAIEDSAVEESALEDAPAAATKRDPDVEAKRLALARKLAAWALSRKDRETP